MFTENSYSSVIHGFHLFHELCHFRSVNFPVLVLVEDVEKTLDFVISNFAHILFLDIMH